MWLIYSVNGAKINNTLKSRNRKIYVQFKGDSHNENNKKHSRPMFPVDFLTFNQVSKSMWWFAFNERTNVSISRITLKSPEHNPSLPLSKTD